MNKKSLEIPKLMNFQVKSQGLFKKQLFGFKNLNNHSY